MSALKSKTHHVVRITYIDASGEHDGGEARVHKSRTCGNCALDGLRDADWIADGGIEQYGRCMDACSAADEADTANQWCSEHRTADEEAASIRRIDRPVFGVIEGGASA